jgi:EmrB/QacA subfamily drug resistance transporter
VNSTADDPIPLRAWIAIAVSSSSVVLLLLDTGMISIAFPTIREDFADVSRSRLAWTASGFFLALASLMLLAGRLADRHGRKRVFLLGLGGYAIGAITCAAAPNEWVLISGRVVMGIGTAMLSPSSLSLVLPLFPPSRRATALGFWALVGSLAGIVAQPIGAAIVEVGSWRLIFVLLCLVALAVLAVGQAVLDEHDIATSHEPLDLRSVVTGSLSLLGVALVLVEGPQWGWTSPRTGVLALATVGIAGWFVQRSLRLPGPLLDLRLFRQRRFAIGTAASFLTQVAFFAFYFSMPIWFREISGYSALEAGLAMTPVNIVATALSVPAGQWIDRRGPRGMMLIGSLVCGAAYSVWIVAAEPSSGWVTMFMPVMVLLGVGGLMAGNSPTSAALHGLPDRDLGSANAAFQVLRRFGSTVGVIVVTAIIGDRSGADLADIFAWVWAVSVVGYLLAGVVATAYPRAVTTAQ